MTLNQRIEHYRALAMLGKLPPEWHPSKRNPYVSEKQYNGFVDSFNNKFIIERYGLYHVSHRQPDHPYSNQYISTPWEAMALLDHSHE